MDKIICLVGESGSGKSTIAEALEKEGYNYIQSYTNRPKRHESEKGHIFIEHGFMDWLFENQCAKIIAETYFDNHYYWATREQYQGKGKSIYIIDPKGVKELKEKVNDAEIVVIYLKADEKTRSTRIINRIKYPGYKTEYYIEKGKIHKRLEHDKKAFAVIQTDYAVDANRSIEEVLKDVKCIIEE